MGKETSSKIFNLAKRASEETATYTRWDAFNFSDSQNGIKESFGQLIYFTDESLSPQESITYTAEQDRIAILLPLTGGLIYSDASFAEAPVKSEQSRIIAVKKGETYTLTNPFENDWVNYLHIGFEEKAISELSSPVVQDLEFKQLNELVCFNNKMEDQPGYIGIYEGRSDGNYTLKDPNNGVFVYIITGAFEVQGRLLEYRDGLSLWNTDEIEFEALSNNAIILILETKLK